MRHRKGSLILMAATLLSLGICSRAVAQEGAPRQEGEDVSGVGDYGADSLNDVLRESSLVDDLGSVISGSDISESSLGIPPEVWSILNSQTGGNGDLGSILGSNGSLGDSLGIPPEVWSILNGQTGGNSDLGSILGGGGFGSVFGSGSTPPLVGLTPGVILNADSGGGLTPTLANPEGLSTPTLSNPGGLVGAVAGGNRSSGVTNINPFSRLFQLLKNNPISRALGRAANQLRGATNSLSFGLFTPNPIIKGRDEANLLDQESARSMARGRLGEDGEKWLAGESQDTMTILQSGVDGANVAVQLAEEAQSLTSTQDVAKAVAQVSGENARLNASILQMQGQTQSSLLQLQQLTSASIQLSANNSEAADETNRRNRVERVNELNKSATATIQVPGTFTSTPSNP